MLRTENYEILVRESLAYGESFELWKLRVGKAWKWDVTDAIWNNKYIYFRDGTVRIEDTSSLI